MTNGISRRRGHDWEREVARNLRELDPNASRETSEPQQGNVGDINTVLPFSIQCKAGRNPSVWKALQEAIEACSEDEVPLAAVKRSHGRGKPAERIAVLQWEAFLALLTRWLVSRLEEKTKYHGS